MFEYSKPETKQDRKFMPYFLKETILLRQFSWEVTKKKDGGYRFDDCKEGPRGKQERLIIVVCLEWMFHLTMIGKKESLFFSPFYFMSVSFL